VVPSYTGVKCLIFTTPTYAASIDTMSLDLAAAMRQLGIGARLLMCTGDTLNTDFLQILLGEIAQHQGPAFIVDINGRYDIKTGTSNFFDEVGVPKFSFMTDNPSALLPKFRDFPNSFLGGLVSREHLEYSASFGLDPERCIFFPHGGPPPLLDQRPTRERDIDILFAGNIQATPPFKDWLEAEFPNFEHVREALIAVEEQLCSPHAQIFTTIMVALEAVGIKRTPQLLSEVFPPTERFFINRERVRILSAIKNHRVTVIGDVSNEITKAFPNHQFIGGQSFTQVMDAMARAKVSLNIVPSFRDGGHERMFYSLAYGSLLLTDYNKFLKDDEASNPFINFFPDDLIELDKMLDQWLSDDTILDNQRSGATDHYAARHTWQQRLLPVLNELDRKYWR